MVIRSVHFVLFLTVVGLFKTTPVSGQADLQWEAYHLAFSGPADFMINTNTRDAFVAGNDNLYMSLSASEDSLSYEGMADATLFKAEELAYDEIHPGKDLALTDFYGHYVKGKKAGAYAICVVLARKESSGIFYADIIYSKGFEKQAMAIAESFAVKP